MFKNIVLFVSVMITLTTPAVAKERKIYNKNQGLNSNIDLTMLYGTWVRADNPKKHKNKFVIITPANPSYLKKAVEFFEAKDKEHRAETGEGWNPYSSLASSYRDKLRDAKRLIKLRLKIDAISAVPPKERKVYGSFALHEALRKAPKDYHEKLYAGSSLAFFKYDLNIYGDDKSSGGSVSISSNYIVHEDMPNRKRHINYVDAIKINKEKYNFDIIGETDVSMLLNNDVNYHFYDIVDENKFIVYRDNGAILHAYKRAKTSYELPYHSQYQSMVDAVNLNEIIK